jgi:hypothetical protein
VFLLVVAALWASLTLRGWWRAVPIAATLVLLAALEWLFTRGYRGVTLLRWRVRSAPGLQVAQCCSLAPPEIWAAALEMYSHFPLFGLGQGAFASVRFRSSPIARRWTPSKEAAPTITSCSLLSNGTVGLGIGARCDSVFRVGRQNFRLISFYALAGVATGMSMPIRS